VWAVGEKEREIKMSEQKTITIRRLKT